jgi:hypothetical protein
MIRAIVLAVLLVGCAKSPAPPERVPREARHESKGPTDFSPPEIATASSFRIPRDHDRFGERFDTKVQQFAQELAHQYGRFGSPEGIEMSPDRRTIVIAVRDHPSTCLCDRERGFRDAGTMVAVVERSSETEPKVTRLFEHEDGGNPIIAIGDDRIAVAQYSRLRVWARGALGEPSEHRITVSPKRLFFTDDGAQIVVVGDIEVEVLDAADFTQRARWRVPGYVRGVALQPSGVLVVQVMPIVTDGEQWVPYRLDGRIARTL